MVHYLDSGEIDPESIVPMVEGGTEGFKGNARVIIPGVTPCIECTLDLYPPQVSFVQSCEALYSRMLSTLQSFR